MKLRVLVAVLLLPMLARADAPPLPALPTIPERTFDVADFGANPDGTSKNTAAIASGIKAAHDAGGGIVRFKPGTYLTGSVELRSNVALHLEKGATLLFSSDPADYPTGLTRWEGTECINYVGLIFARDAHDIAITGQGTIDGQGKPWWKWMLHARPAAKKLREMGETTDDPKLRVFGTPEAGLRPCLFEPINCQRILLDGITFTNSPFWTLHPVYCSDITARNLTVHGTGPNTDGLNPDSCRNILIENCAFDTGDDCITLKSGRDRDGRRVAKPTENVVVRNCSFKRGHGTVVIGSEMSGGVRNVLAENLTADGTDAGVRIKTRRGRGGAVENVIYRNLTLKNIEKQAITIDMFYDVGNNPQVEQTSADGIPSIRNITIENLTCDGAAQAILIRGLPDSPIQTVNMTDIRIVANEGMTVSGAKDVTGTNIDVKLAPSTQPAR